MRTSIRIITCSLLLAAPWAASAQTKAKAPAPVKKRTAISLKLWTWEECDREYFSKEYTDAEYAKFDKNMLKQCDKLSEDAAEREAQESNEKYCKSVNPAYNSTLPNGTVLGCTDSIFEPASTSSPLADPAFRPARYASIRVDVARHSETSKPGPAYDEVTNKWGSNPPHPDQDFSLIRESECAPLGLDTETLHRRLGSLRNQGAMGWCWAYALGDVLTSCVRGQREASGTPLDSDDWSIDAQRPSAYDLAMLHALDSKKQGNTTPIDGGPDVSYIKDPALQAFVGQFEWGGDPLMNLELLANAGGFCSEADGPSDPTSFLLKERKSGQFDPKIWQNPPMKEFKHEIAKFVQLRQDYQIYLDSGRNPEKLPSCLKPRGENEFGPLNQERWICFHQLGRTNPEVFSNNNISALMDQYSTKDFLEALHSRLCNRRVSIEGCTKARGWYLSGPWQTDPATGKPLKDHAGTVTGIRFLDEQLARKQVVGISVDSEFLWTDRESNPEAVGHAVVVQRRVWKDGACRYEIRNSWGASCDGQKGKFASCDPKTNLLYPTVDTLSKNLTSVFTIGKD